MGISSSFSKDAVTLKTEATSSSEMFLSHDVKLRNNYASCWSRTCFDSAMSRAQNYDQRPTIRTCFLGFPQSVQENAGLVGWITARPFAVTYFQAN